MINSLAHFFPSSLYDFYEQMTINARFHILASNSHECSDMGEKASRSTLPKRQVGGAVINDSKQGFCYHLHKSSHHRGETMPHQRIEMNPQIMTGKPIIRGTRIPVELVLRKLSSGMTPEAILTDHPRLTAEDIQAAQAFAAGCLADEHIIG